MSVIDRDTFHKLFGDGDAANLDGEYAGAYDRQVLVALCRTLQPKTVVEFGVQRGITAALLLRECDCIETYVGIDATADFVPRLQGQLPEVPKEGTFGELVADDRRFQLVQVPGGTVKLDPDSLPTADLIYIDGDHSAEGVARETSLARAIVRPGGVIVWHDYGNATVEVSGVVDALNRGEGDHIMLIAGTWMCVELRRTGREKPVKATRTTTRKRRTAAKGTGK